MFCGVCPEASPVRSAPSDLNKKGEKTSPEKTPPAPLDRAARLIESGRISCDEIVTATIPLSEAGEAVSAFNDRRDSQVKRAADPWMTSH